MEYMAELVKCKACGFTIEKGKLGELCPACGVPKSAFEEYEPKISESRRKILDFHIHPVLVRFPQAFSISLLFFILINLFFPNFLRTEILNSIYILSLLLPFVVLASILGGLLDGKIRFKKLNTPHLKKKIIVGIIFLILSWIQFIIVLSIPVDAVLIYLLFSNLGGVLCGGYLGLIGGTLLEAKLPN